MSRRPIKFEFRLSPAAKEILGAALAHAEDRPVFPCHPATKAPLTRAGFKDATNDAAIVEQWWKQFPGALIGMPTGPASGLWVLDLDVDVDKGINGIAAFSQIRKGRDRLPATLASRTPRGGLHLFWTWPNRGEIRNSTSQIAPGVDTRGDGGYVVLPPSVRQDGAAYSWHPSSLTTAAPAPDWLLELATATNGHGESGARANGHRIPQTARWRELARGVSEGARNDSAARLAGYLLRHLIDPVVALELLNAWNEARCSPPLSPDEIAQTLDSICTKELRRRSSHEHG